MGEVHDAAIIATCIRAHNSNPFHAPCPYASCNDCCIVHFTHCKLHRWCFSFPPLAQILYLHLSNLHCVVIQYTYVHARVNNLLSNGQQSNTRTCTVLKTSAIHSNTMQCAQPLPCELLTGIHTTYCLHPKSALGLHSLGLFWCCN